MNFKNIKRCSITKDNRSDSFCAPAVLKRWGIHFPNRPASIMEIYCALFDAKIKFDSRRLAFWIQDEITGTKLHERPDTKYYPTVTKFLEYVKTHPDFKGKDVIFFTRGHIMCIKDGVLTDTDRTATGRRRVTEYYLVERS